MISVAQLIIHIYFGAIAGGILGFTISTYGEWFEEPVVVQLPIVRTPQVEGSENNVDVAPGENSQPGELE